MLHRMSSDRLGRPYIATIPTEDDDPYGESQGYERAGGVVGSKDDGDFSDDEVGDMERGFAPRKAVTNGKGKGKATKHHGKGGPHAKGRKRKGNRKHRDSGRHSSPMSPSQAYELLEKFSITLVPLSNPDGYAYTWQDGGNRMWRKNRQPAEEGENAGDCVGIDVNRNWVSACSKKKR